jgi:hypothetical protein
MVVKWPPSKERKQKGGNINLPDLRSNNTLVIDLE